MWQPWLDDSSMNLNNEDEAIIVDDEVQPSSSNDCEEMISSQRTHLPVAAKNIILNVYRYLLEVEKEENPIKKTSIMTSVPYTTVWRCVNEKIQERRTRTDRGTSRKLNVQHHAHLVRTTIYEMFEEKMVPTLTSLREKLIVDKFIGIDFCTVTLRKFVQSIGFSYKTIDKRQVIMETPKIREWRYNYLKEIQKCREDNKIIYYLDETWYDTHDVVKKGWVDDSNKCVLDVPSARGKRIIILHAGSKLGWVPNGLLLSAKAIKDAKLDYHEDMSGDLFYNWFKAFLENIEPHSIIVLDNASYHSVVSNKIPNSNSTKTEIMEFLYERDIYFEESYSKKQLIEVLRTFSFKKTFMIDQLAAEKGHKVIRLPPYHCCFNPIELIWATLKKNIRKNNKNPKFSSETVTLIQNEVDKIGCELWNNCINHVIKVEETYRSKFVNELIIHVNDSDTDGDSDDD